MPGVTHELSCELCEWAVPLWFIDRPSEADWSMALLHCALQHPDTFDSMLPTLREALGDERLDRSDLAQRLIDEISALSPDLAAEEIVSAATERDWWER